MSFYEDNLALIEQIRADPSIVQELYKLHREMPDDRLVGRSQRQTGRSFYSAKRPISEVPLGIKTGESFVIELEIATFHYLHDNIEGLQPKLPRVIGLLETDREETRRSQTHWTTVMEDFSVGLTLRVEESQQFLPSLKRLCAANCPDSEIKKAAFSIYAGNDLVNICIGDLGSLYIQLKDEVRKEIQGIARVHYLDSRLEALVIKR